MSFNRYQQQKVDKLLKTDFLIHYEKIPVEYKKNHYFEQFLFNMAEIYSMIKIAKERDFSDIVQKFEVIEENNQIITYLEFLWMDEKVVDKREMRVVLEKSGTVSFKWNFAFITDEKEKRKEYISSQDDAIYELRMELGEDNSQVFLEYTTTSNKEIPYQCTMNSIFDTNGNELQRVASAKNTETNETIYEEEFFWIEHLEDSNLEKLQERAEREPIQIVRLSGENAPLYEVKYCQIIEQVYLGRCTVNQETRYAICWKPDCFVNKEYQKTIESISRFGAPGNHLCNTLKTDPKPWLTEISEEEYNILANKEQIKPYIKQKKI